MAQTDYIPRKDPAYLAWHDLFKAGVLAQAATFGLVAGDTTPITTDNTDLHTKITNVNTTGAVASQAVADKNISRGNSEKRARALAGRIKKHPAYTVALGALLGIIGAEDTTDLAGVPPVISGSDRTGGVVQIDFNKSTSDGVNIYSKRDGDVDFVFLARDTQTPYVDNRALKVAGKPELREYKAMYVLGDDEIGIFSHELVVNCAP